MDKELLLTMVEAIIENIDSLVDDVSDLENKSIKELHNEIYGFRRNKGIINYLRELNEDLSVIYDYIRDNVKEEK